MLHLFYLKNCVTYAVSLFTFMKFQKYLTYPLTSHESRCIASFFAHLFSGHKQLQVLVAFARYFNLNVVGILKKIQIVLPLKAQFICRITKFIIFYAYTMISELWDVDAVKHTPMY